MQDVLDYLYGLTRFGIKPGLEVTRSLLTVLGNPHQKFKSVHITGTNGKGSTTAFTASILQKAGYKVGMYTSPHLVRFNERININGVDISDAELVKFAALIKATAEAHGIQPTFFEFTTVLAFFYFAANNVDIAVIEVGLGGRLDATNVITPLVSVITNIDFDHMKHLGDTKEKIALEKAGIIKKNVPLVTAEKDENIIGIFRNKAERIFVLKEDLYVIPGAKSIDFQSFAVSGRVNGVFTTSLLGDHQIDNACTALLAAQVLRENGLQITDKALHDGLIAAHWPGRLQVISKTPLLILDGAHNVAGMNRLKQFIQPLQKKKVLVLALAKDKDTKEIVKLIAPLFTTVIIAQGNFKPQDTAVLAAEARKYVHDVKELPDVEEALHTALSAVKDDELILVTGSLYMLGDALSVLEKSAKIRDKLGQAGIEQVQ